MKILLDKYPYGTYKGQKSDGKYIDGYLYDNLTILARRIVDDMTFMGVIFSSTLEVGTGKSVLGTQIGEAWSYIMKKEHNIDIPFDVNNVVWRPKDLIERAFKVPRYSFLLLDEWEDATYWSQLGITLRQFFRKCRQLNLFMMIIIPNWFQLPLPYAISRSVFAIDVKFERDFRRGYFSFYSFSAKRDLYIKGKKEHNYKVAKPTFNGMFVNGYGVDEKQYRALKLKDMMEYDQDKESKVNLTQRQVQIKLLQQIRKNFPKITLKTLSQMFEVSETSIKLWSKTDLSKEFELRKDYELNYDNNTNDSEVVWDEERIEKEGKQNQDNIEDRKV